MAETSQIKNSYYGTFANLYDNKRIKFYACSLLFTMIIISVVVIMVLVLTSLTSSNSFESTSSNSFESTSSSLYSRCSDVSEYCNIGLDCPLFNAQPIPTEQKRVRRNIKYFTDTEFDAFATALLIMKNTSIVDGVNRFGLAFKNYDYFLAKHITGATDKRGDQGHSSSAFIIFHILLLSEVEQTLLSIDPTIGALPYWDWPDFSFTLFTDDRFGELPGNGVDMEVTTSMFRNWIISDMDTATWQSKYGPWIHNMSQCSYDGGTEMGYFRDVSSMASTAHLVRMGSGLTSPTVGNCTYADKFPFSEWYGCVDVCVNSGVVYHGSLHTQIAGNINGDFKSTATSFNEPLFLLHHSNLVRSHYSWMLNNADTAPCFFGYPVEGFACDSSAMLPPYEGLALNDTVSSNFPFYDSQVGHSRGSSLHPWTVAEALRYFQPDYSPYTYDDFDMAV